MHAPAFPPLCNWMLGGPWSCSTCRLSYLCQGLYPRWQDRPPKRQAQSTALWSCCLDHQASRCSCWALMPLGLSEHSNRLSVQPCGCCRECSALLSCCNQAIVVLCNSCHVHHKIRIKIEGDHQPLPSAPSHTKPCCFKVFDIPGVCLGKAPLCRDM